MSDEQITPTTPVVPVQGPGPVPASEPRHNIFRGPNGIRAGWRVLIFLALIFAAVLLVAIPFAIAKMLRGGGPHASFGVPALSPAALSITEGSLFLFPAIAALIMARIERRKFGSTGYRRDMLFEKTSGSE